MKARIAILVTVLALAITSVASALNGDPGDGGAGYPWNTGQCAYWRGNLSSWLEGGYGTGWGYWCDSNGLISYWSASSGWRYLGWD